MDTTTFFTPLNALMKENPPAAADAPGDLAYRGHRCRTGENFDIKTLDPDTARGLQRAALAGQDILVRESKKPQGTMVNGWSITPPNVGNFGADYRLRAVIALAGLGAIYPHAEVDAQGQPPNGEHRYLVRFQKGHTPPVNAFWSMTMHNSKQAFIQNPINPYAIGDRDRLKLDHDGSLSIYIQHDSPGKNKESNWLPAPADSFNVIMRLYWPKQEIVDGTWKMPPVEKVS